MTTRIAMLAIVLLWASPGIGGLSTHVPLDLNEAHVWASGRVKPGRAQSSGAVDNPEGFDVSDGITVTIADGGTTAVSVSFAASDCTVRSSGQFRCRTDATQPRRKKVSFRPVLPTGRWRFKIRLRDVDVAAALAGPVTVTVEDSTPRVFSGQLADCVGGGGAPLLACRD